MIDTELFSKDTSLALKFVKLKSSFALSLFNVVAMARPNDHA